MNHHHDHLDDDLRPLSDALDKLGAAERDGAPPDLERDLFAATRAALSPEPQAAPDVVARIGPARHPLRLAALVTLAATATIVGLFILNAPTPAPRTSDQLAERTPDQIIEDIDAQLTDWLEDVEALDTEYAVSNDAPPDFWSVEDDLAQIILEENAS